MKPLFLSLVFLLVSWQAAYSQDLTFQFTNPAFGGNALNYGWLLNSANAQNSFSDPAADANQQDDQLTQFTENLNRQLLNQLSRDLINEQFGEEGLTEGTYQFGDFQIDISPGLDGLVITINDLSTGGHTAITIPYL
jgi:curli production assembly/transport component CsgF